MSEAPLVLVTGVSGFVAGWVAYGALKMGYRVRGTVRSLADPKVDADLCPGSRYKIELVEADLTDEECWTAAVEGCEYILHVASPNPLVFPKDPNDVIRPAVEGTPNVLKAASKMATPPKRVVVTSSCAAVFAGTDPTNKVYTDADWTVPDSKQFPISTYYRSKLEAERAAWAFVEGLPNDHKFELATVNPSLVQGPLLSGAKSCTSADIIKQLLMGEMPALFKWTIGIVSVLDVARAHLLAMTVPEAAGKRFLLSNGNLTLKEMSNVLSAEFGPLGYKPTSKVAPSWLIRTMAFFGDSQAKVISPLLGIVQVMDSVNAKSVLHMPLEYDPKIILQMAYEAIACGVIKDKSQDCTITKNYVRPEMDVSGIPSPGIP